MDFLFPSFFLLPVYLLQPHPPLSPPPILHAQLHRRTSPVLPMTMPLRLPPFSPFQPCPRQPLPLRQHSQQPKHHGDPHFQLTPHQPVAHRIRDVLKVHSLALDQHADRDDRIKRAAQRLLLILPLPQLHIRARGARRRAERRLRGILEVVGTAQQIRDAARDGLSDAREAGRLDLAGGVELGDGEGQLVGARDGLGDDVFGAHARG